MFENAHFINMAFDPAVPYNDLPLLPPSVASARSVSLSDLENTAVLKACIQARAALAELNELSAHFPYTDMLWKNFTTLSAWSGARLDGHHFKCEELFQLNGEPSDIEVTLQRAVRLRNASLLGYELTRDQELNVSVLLELCSAIEGSPMPVRRRSISVIDKNDAQSVAYTPPVGAELIQRLLGNWERFVHVEAESLDPLVIMAIAHYQLMAIQPFSAGNNAVARLVDNLLLAEENLLNLPVLNMGDWYYRHRVEYQKLYSDVTQQQHWQDWIVFMVNGVAASSDSAINRLRSIIALLHDTDSLIRDKLPKIADDELTRIIFCDPCVRIQNLVEAGIARRQTASVYLKNLCEIGVLSEIPYGKEKLFVHQKLLKLLTDDSVQFAPYAR